MQESPSVKTLIPRKSQERLARPRSSHQASINKTLQKSFDRSQRSSLERKDSTMLLRQSREASIDRDPYEIGKHIQATHSRPRSAVSTVSNKSRGQRQASASNFKTKTGEFTVAKTVTEKIVERVASLPSESNRTGPKKIALNHSSQRFNIITGRMLSNCSPSSIPNFIQGGESMDSIKIN